MATLAQTECREVCYPEKCRSVQARKKHKEKTLRDNPDVLYADYIQLNGKRIKNNFIFHTTMIKAWKLAISRVEKERDETHVNCTDSEDEGPMNPSPSSSERQLRDSLALLELDFTEFREHIQVKLSDTHNTNNYIQELKDKLQQLKKNTSSSITELTRALRELQEENRTLRLQLCKLEEDT
ncbi:Large tegument protein deneddylase [Labeo rohita]|uniref:Large tegument protein deneddylase n=1 Tax=Labeo rohita TaxID=84645 RepID=A0ABQ8L2C0_LABRO|nr:Large tegument protein deneddylase [Labeo rohita]